MTQSETGLANGSNVYQWSHGCTPSGFQVSNVWCGSQYNGGGWPTYGMLFGYDANVCTVKLGSVGAGCFAHGMRRWIDDYGNLSTFYYW